MGLSPRQESLVTEATDFKHYEESCASPSNSGGGVSSVGAIFNILATAVGVGMLALPNAVAKAGYIVGFGLFVFCVGVAVFCCFLLEKSMRLAAIHVSKSSDPTRSVRTYEDIGRVAYGKIGAACVSGALHSALIGCCCLIALLMGGALHRLGPSISQSVWIVISCAVMLPFVWLRTMKHLAMVTSTFGSGSIAGLTVAIVIASILFVSEDKGATWLKGNPVREYSPLPTSLWSLGTAFGSLTFAFAVTCTIPTILHDMQTKKDAKKVIVIGLGATSLVYMTVTLAGYLAFGSLMLTDGVDGFVSILEPGTPIAIATDILLLLVCVTHYAVMLNPTCRALEDMMGISKMTDFRKSLVVGCILRSLLVAFTAIIAIFCGQFSALVDIIGSVSFALVHMVFPPIFYLRLETLAGRRIFNTRREKTITVLCVGLVVLAIVGAVFGCASSITTLL
jgi:amino acid permease